MPKYDYTVQKSSKAFVVEPLANPTPIGERPVFILTKQPAQPHIKKLTDELTMRSINYQIYQGNTLFGVQLNQRFFVVVDNSLGEVKLSWELGSKMLTIVGYPKIGTETANDYRETPTGVLDLYGKYRNSSSETSIGSKIFTTRTDLSRNSISPSSKSRIQLRSIQRISSQEKLGSPRNRPKKTKFIVIEEPNDLQYTKFIQKNLQPKENDTISIVKIANKNGFMVENIKNPNIKFYHVASLKTFSGVNGIPQNGEYIILCLSQAGDKLQLEKKGLNISSKSNIYAISYDDTETRKIFQSFGVKIKDEAKIGSKLRETVNSNMDEPRNSQLSGKYRSTDSNQTGTFYELNHEVDKEHISGEENNPPKNMKSTKKTSIEDIDMSVTLNRSNGFQVKSGKTLPNLQDTNRFVDSPKMGATELPGDNLETIGYKRHRKRSRQHKQQSSSKKQYHGESRSRSKSSHNSPRQKVKRVSMESAQTNIKMKQVKFFDEPPPMITDTYKIRSSESFKHAPQTIAFESESVRILPAGAMIKTLDREESTRPNLAAILYKDFNPKIESLLADLKKRLRMNDSDCCTFFNAVELQKGVRRAKKKGFDKQPKLKDCLFLVLAEPGDLQSIVESCTPINRVEEREAKNNKPTLMSTFVVFFIDEDVKKSSDCMHYTTIHYRSIALKDTRQTSLAIIEELKKHKPSMNIMSTKPLFG